MNTWYDFFALQEICMALIPYLPALLLFLAYYALIYRPQKKALLNFEQMLETISIGQRLVTRGGMIGVVVEILPLSFILEVYDGSKVEVLKEGIATILHE